MEAVIINGNQKKQWEEYVQQNRHAIAWQCYEWSDVLGRHYKFKYFPIAAMEAGKIVGILPLYSIRTYFSKETLISVPFAVAGGLVADDEEARRLLIGKAIELSDKRGSCRITLKQYKIRMEGNFQTDDNYYNRELSLTSDIGKIWGQFAERNRERVGCTEKFSIVLDAPSDEVGLFHKLLLQHSHARGIPCVSRRWIEDLLRFKMYTIALLKNHGDIIAGTLVKEFKKTVSFPFTCVRQPSTKNISFAYRLYWELLKYYSSKGFEIFHSGRIPTNDVTDEYRLGWGGTKHGYYYQYYPRGNAKTEFATKRGGKRALMEKFWKVMPLGMARAMGPHVVRQFP